MEHIYSIHRGGVSVAEDLEDTQKNDLLPAAGAKVRAISWNGVSVLEAYSRATKSHNTETKKQGLGLGRLHKKASE